MRNVLLPESHRFAFNLFLQQRTYALPYTIVETVFTIGLRYNNIASCH